MSNINRPGGWHGVDDEFNYGQPKRCAVCWAKAKRRFFDPARQPRRGATLDSVYSDVHQREHEE